MDENDDKSYSKKPVVASVVVVLLYYFFLIVSSLLTELIGISLGPDIVSVLIPYAGIIETVVTFGLMSLLLFKIFPTKIPYPTNSESMKNHFDEIRLTPRNPLKYNLVVGCVMTLSLIAISFTFGLATGTWNYNEALTRILPPDSWSLITAIIPGVFEEVAFRGIIFSTMLARYKENNAVLGSSVVFGLAHAMNIVAGADLVITIAQVGYGFFLGILFAKIVLKTDSLIPGIILHYFIAAIGQFFVYSIFELQAYALLKIGYMILGIGIIPMLAGIILLKFFDRISHETRKQMKDLSSKVIPLKNF